MRIRAIFDHYEPRAIIGMRIRRDSNRLKKCESSFFSFARKNCDFRAPYVWFFLVVYIGLDAKIGYMYIILTRLEDIEMFGAFG
jgi:hypothetical protein